MQIQVVSADFAKAKQPASLPPSKRLPLGARGGKAMRARGAVKNAIRQTVRGRGQGANKFRIAAGIGRGAGRGARGRREAARGKYLHLLIAFLLLFLF